ncbi:GAF domain-containing sensor histidine kinase [Opitutus sp. ER46]|uniref:sensor histidine kinase n=1 Tax=Opitutus sp. ER46 TaxID=2161864 RepID=UPI000D2F5BF8|nr:GAF domain-containing sensor histidine kinase [Opitutus sp. ER46]PTX96509.1 hypothetical protein DB354_07585 [Opitutus sp. ER46]
MPPSPSSPSASRGALLSLLIFAGSVGVMGWLRLVVFRHTHVTLTYGLPLLLCLWHPSRRLLWTMTSAFVALSAYKAFAILTFEAGYTIAATTAQWVMQLVNIIAVAAAVHVVLRHREQLAERHRQLESTNHQLLEREAEIARQNEELQAQSEELQAQGEELTTQNEELIRRATEEQAQTDKLHAQAAALQTLNARLVQREAMVTTLLQASQAPGGGVPDTIAGPLLALFQGNADAVAIVEAVGEQLRVIAFAGPTDFVPRGGPLAGSFAAAVIAQRRTAFVADLVARPELSVQAGPRVPFRSVLGTPLRLGDGVAGAIEVYASTPRPWTDEDFHVVEWASSQCSLFVQVRRLNAELRAINSQLDGLVVARTAELRRVVAELEHFSYTITHDMRAPLRALQGYSTLVLEQNGDRLDAECRAYLDRINAAASRMDRLITDALSFTHAAKQDLPLTPTPPAPLLWEMIASYPNLGPAAATIEIVGDLPAVMANEAGLTQCFSNLLGNAVKFVPPGRRPEVRIRAERRGGNVRLWVEDNGIGIPAESQPRLFAMFQRLHREYEGTGIGLALVKTVVARMGGTVGVESSAGQGSRFWLELPAAPAS